MSLQGAKLAGGNPENKRVENDYYATNPEAVRMLLKSYHGFDKIKTILEPCVNVDLPIYIECKDGAENNSFYDKIAYFERTEDRKTMKVRFYKLNREEWR